MLTCLIRSNFKLKLLNAPFSVQSRQSFLLWSSFKYASIATSACNLASQSDLKNVTLKFDTGILELNKGQLARLADSSATGQYNDTNVLVTVVNKQKSPPASFLPLTVDYMHKASAAGKIPTNYQRRDMGASNHEILVSRMIDRSIRPLFSSNNFSNETQIVCNLLSYNGQDNPDVLCINTVSFALYNSNIPWNGPIGCVRVGMLNNEFIINPSRKQLEKSPLNLVLSVGKNKNILMIEAWGEDVSQSKFTEAIEFGSKQAYKIVKNIQSSNTVSESRQSIDITTEEKSDEQKENIISIELDKINNKFYEAAYSQLYDIFNDYTHDKRSRDDAISMIRNSTINAILKNENKQQDLQLKATVYNYQTLSEHFMKFTKNIVRNLVLEESKRVDGRSLDELRPITCKTNLYKALHGSALFQRGQTQVLCSITFDSPESMYKQDAIFNMMSPSLTNFNKNFMLHYEFPSYAINEISRIGGRADRREIGHGALAEKSVYPMMPNEFPFTVRALCEVLESNGSSSMASVCATSMALMDAGVPIKRSVCGVAMGIITKFDETKENLIEYKILTDISGFEDYMGDMDFKIAGTQDGITAIQADFKIMGLPFEIVSEIIQKSKDARCKILSLMDAEISKPKESKKSNHPIIKNLSVSIEQRGKFIGPGGVNLKRISQKTGVTISSNDDLNFTLFAPNRNALEEAEEMIKIILNFQKEPELEFGSVYAAKVVEIVPGGLMVQFYSNMKPALLPNSQLDGRKIVHGSVSEFKVGQEIQVKYFGRDPVDGKMRISRKALFKTATPAKDLFK